MFICVNTNEGFLFETLAERKIHQNSEKMYQDIG